PEIAEIVSLLTAKGIKTTTLKVSHGFHSPLMQEMLNSFETQARQISYHAPEIPIISNVTGERAAPSIATAEYWVNHVIKPVRFADSIKTLETEDYGIFIEIGPKPILLGMGSQCVGENKYLWLASLREEVGAWEQMLCSLGKLYVQGVDIDWLGFEGDDRRNKVVLPTYPFQRQSYWIESLEISKPIVIDYYDELINFEKEDEEIILNYAPLPQIIPGFSWLIEISEKKHDNLLKIAQQEIRRIAYEKIDFNCCKKVLDFGCGHGTDLIDLAKNHENMKLCGYTISKEQVELAHKKINRLNLQDRVQIFNRNSSHDEFPDNYDMIYGFEVACHVKNKEGLFTNIGNHLNQDGHLVLSDFISSGSFSIDYDAHSSYLIPKKEWLNLLSNNNLQIVDYVDISQEIANGLYDPNFENNLEYVCKKFNFSENTKVGFKSYDNLYKMLRRGLVSYVILSAKKQNNLPVNEIYQWNQEKLNAPLYYSDVSLQQLFYGVEWQNQIPKDKYLIKKSIPATEKGTWLIFSDLGGVGLQLRKIIEESGDRCVMIFPGQTCKKQGRESWEINPSEQDDFEFLCHEIVATNSDSWKGIVHLWSLESSPSVELTTSSLEQAQRLGCGSMLHLTQVLVRNFKSISPQLWLITRGSQPVISQTKELAVAQTPLWGLGKVISLEYPQLWGGLIDLDPKISENEAEILWQNITGTQQEAQIAFRSGKTYVARLVKKLLPKFQPVSFDGKGTYLITGGLGSLGLQAAQWLVSQQAKYLVLMSRGKPNELAQATISNLEQRGTKIIIAEADVSKKEDLVRVMEQMKKSMPPLKGVIHAAGVVKVQPFEEIKLNHLEAILRPKVIGGWLLHQLTQDREIDFFVNFSSIAAVWGSVDQAHYAAANHFLDGLSHYRQAIGLPSNSINWGPWAGGGMADTERLNWLSKIGIKSLAPQKGIAALSELLATNNPQTVVADIDWALFKQFYEVEQKRLFLEKIDSYSKTENVERVSEQTSEIMKKLNEAQKNKRQQVLSYYLQIEIGKLLGFSHSLLPELDLGLFDMGMNSLSLVELRNLLNYSLNCSISTATLFDISNIQELSKYLIKKLFSEEQESEDKFDKIQNEHLPNIGNLEYKEKINDEIAEELEKIQILIQE
ncbi:MAG: SDR family NAD(P)-dependent oxidoreductase, partial [Okeania sp. SIO1H6]|nr:SDR family NAD(P)-dependent oxidoreductase [Okeania sp. SIO1H6]